MWCRVVCIQTGLWSGTVRRWCCGLWIVDCGLCEVLSLLGSMAAIEKFEGKRDVRCALDCDV